MPIEIAEKPDKAAGAFGPQLRAWRGAQSLHAGQEEEVWLLGQPPLWRFVEFIEESVVDAAHSTRAALIDEWRAANDYYQQLERIEAGIANAASHRDLDPELEPLSREVRAHPLYRRAFHTLPATFAMVELDRLIVFQKHVNGTFVDRLRARIGAPPDPETLFRICLPLDPATPAVQICQLEARRFVFRCNSTDLRFLETAVLRPEQVRGYEGGGIVAGMIAAVVGFGCSFMQAVRVGNRMLLNNGYHRACALRALGVTHVPCIVETATRVDELELVVRDRVAEEAGFYFESARPPLLKDFFDPKIRKVLPAPPRSQLVEVSVEIRDLVEERVVTTD